MAAAQSVVGSKRRAPASPEGQRPPPTKRASLTDAAQIGGSRYRVLAAVYSAMEGMQDDTEDERQAALDAALLAAAGSNQHPEACIAAMQALLDAGADPNMQGKAGLPALHAFIAGMRQRQGWAEWQVLSAVGALLSAGADACGCTSEGLDCLDFAAACTCPAAVRACIPALVAAGADPTVPNAMGEPPLYSAAMNSNAASCLAAVELLLAAGADPMAGPVAPADGLKENSSAEAAALAGRALASAMSERYASAQAAWQQEREEAAEQRQQQEAREAALCAGWRQQAAGWQKERTQFCQHLAQYRQTVQHLGAQLASCQKQLQDVQAEQERARVCVVCMAAARTVALSCGHLAMCSACCAHTCNQCPICRQHSPTTLTIHIP